MRAITSKILPFNTLEEAADLAAAWGLEDALEGIPNRSAQFFDFDSIRMAAYESGYAEGIEILFHLTGANHRHPRALCHFERTDFYDEF